MSTVTVIANMLILSLLTGVCAHGMLVYAQRTIQIGTIGIGQIVQPALAGIWSYVLLGALRTDNHLGGRRPTLTPCTSLLSCS